MRSSTLLIAASISLLGIVAGCTESEHRTDASQPAETRCRLLEGRRFQTVELQDDCGPAPAGSNITCNWNISFAPFDATATEFSAHVSDTVESGYAQCNGSEIVDDRGNVRGSYDEASDRLTWHGVVYAHSP